MALPLKSGADLYTQEIRRVALQNEGSDLAEYITGSIYFNTNSANSNSSNRIRYRGLTAWHSVANIEDIESLQEQIDNIDFASSEEFTSLKERVDAFLDGEVDSDAVLDNLKEIQAFLDNYSSATSLVDLLATKADKATTLAGYGITDAFVVGGTASGDLNALKTNASYYVADSATNRPSAYGQLLVLRNADTTGQIYVDVFEHGSMFWRGFNDDATSLMAWRKVLDSNNYASVLGTVYAPYHSAGYLPLSGGIITGSLSLSSVSGTTRSNSIVFRDNFWNGFLYQENSKLYWGHYDNTSNDYEVVHANNFAEIGAAKASGQWGIGLKAVTNLTDLNDAQYGYLFSITANYGETTGNKPHESFAAGLTWTIDNNDSYRAQIASTSDGNNLYFRKCAGTWYDWKTIAFTDSDITGYAAGLKHSNGTIGAIVNSSGYVGIGTTAPAYKLDVNGDLHVSGNIIADGQVSSGGIADEAASGGSGLEKVVFTLEAGQTSYECEHNLATREITVSIYEEGDDYQQVLTDVYLDDEYTARIVFGSATDVAHKVVIVG